MKEIEDTLVEFGRAAAGQDIAAMLDLFADDAEVVLFASEEAQVALGRDELRAVLEHILTREGAAQVKWERTAVTVRGDIAWVAALGELRWSERGHKELASHENVSPYRATVVLERLDGRWRWRQFHGSRPATPR